MKSIPFALGAALLLGGCNQAAPVTSAPTATAESAAAPVSADSAVATAAAPPAAAPATASAPAAAPKLAEAEAIKASFRFRPAPDPDNPSHPRTSAHLLLQGRQPLDVDLGKFVGKPDVVDATKAKAANFPSGMLMGFRSYSAATGTSQDLAVLSVDGHRLRIVQRKVEEAAAEPGTFETAREIPLPGNTRVVVATPSAKK